MYLNTSFATYGANRMNYRNNNLRTINFAGDMNEFQSKKMISKLRPKVSAVYTKNESEQQIIAGLYKKARELGKFNGSFARIEIPNKYLDELLKTYGQHVNTTGKKGICFVLGDKFSEAEHFSEIYDAQVLLVPEK